MASRTVLSRTDRTDPSRSIRNAGLTAGIGLLLMSALSAFGYFVAIKGLITQGDAELTASEIRGSDSLFRYGIVSLYVVIVLDVVVAWALYRVFRPVNKAVSILAGCLRMIYSGVFLVAISQLVAVPRLLGDDRYLAVYSPDQLHAQALLTINAFNDVWHAGLLLFGTHLLIIGYLAFKSGFVLRLLGVLLVIDGLSYVVDTFGTVLSRGPWTDTATFTFLGEFLLALWLVIRSRRLTADDSAGHEGVAVPVAR
jgi:hypothetical protein